MLHVWSEDRFVKSVFSFLLHVGKPKTLGLRHKCHLTGLWFLIKTVAQAGLKLPVLFLLPA